MYTVVFENENGRKYVFGKDGHTVADFDFGKGVSVSLGTSQGFAQIGETVDTQSVEGRSITAKGVIYKDYAANKTLLRNVCSPFAKGKLIFNDKYYINVVVKDAPTFAMKRKEGEFSMRFFAPFPFFSVVGGGSVAIGAVLPMFKFPVNYSTPHYFGKRNAAGYVNIVNDGDVSIPFSARIVVKDDVTDFMLINLKTFEYLKIEGDLQGGDEVNIYRTPSNVLRAELTSSNGTEDILYRISDESELFELAIGDNFIRADDGNDGQSTMVQITYNKAVAAVYED
jgi:hypothetical protein